jgi:hypothetical protein
MFVGVGNLVVSDLGEVKIARNGLEPRAPRVPDLLNANDTMIMAAERDHVT